MTTQNEPKGVYIDIRTIPVPRGHVPLEYDQDGSLLFAWDTKALDHSRWPVNDFEEAVLAAVLEAGLPQTFDDLTILTAARRAQVYTNWRDEGGWELHRDEKARLKAAAEAAAGDVPPNPLLDPIQGVSLSEYAQVQIKTAEGIDRGAILAALEIDPAVWAEASQGWLDRMQSGSASVSGEFSRLYQDGITDPRLMALSRATQSTSPANLERLRNDPTFVIELSAARSAAYGAGLDGDAWMMRTFGISPPDFHAIEDARQKQAAQLSEKATAGGFDERQALLIADAVSDSDVEQWRQLSLRAVAGDEAAREYIKDHMNGTLNWLNLQSAYYDAYVQRFTAQMGGGVADDITF